MRRTQPYRPFPHRGFVPLVAAGFWGATLLLLEAADPQIERRLWPELVLAGALPCSLLWRQLWILPVGPEAEPGGARAFQALAGPGVLWGFLTGILAVSLSGLLYWLRIGMETPVLLAIPLAILLAPVAAVVLAVLSPLYISLMVSYPLAAVPMLIALVGGVCTAGVVAWLWKYYPVRHPVQAVEPAAPSPSKETPADLPQAAESEPPTASPGSG
ncbi:MAG: hypothetical protein FJX77_03700 [Armatimonadetes bacterium]|nr:hypothetical protein [Armatimonadota bacterium]